MDCGHEECPRAGCRIEEVYRFISKSFFFPEFITENPINTSHDVVHDRFRRIVHATRFTLFRVVFREKWFVELNNRVFARLVLNEFLTNTINLGSIQLIDEQLGRFVNVRDCGCYFFDEVVQVGKNRDVCRKVVNRVRERQFVAVAASLMFKRGEKQGVCHRLRDHVGELVRRYILNERFLKSLFKFPEIRFFISRFECFLNLLGEQARLFRKRKRKLFRGSCLIDAALKESNEQLFKIFRRSAVQRCKVKNDCFADLF